MKDFNGNPTAVVKTLLRKVKKNKIKNEKTCYKCVINACQLKIFSAMIVVFTDFPLFHDPKL